MVHGGGVGGERHAIHVRFDGGDAAGHGGRARGGRVLSRGVRRVVGVVGGVVGGGTGVGIGVVVVGRAAIVVGGVGRGIVEIVEIVGHLFAEWKWRLGQGGRGRGAAITKF